jgi:hypothetical protein
MKIPTIPQGIERLEARIAPAAVFTYTDVDGDHVTIQTSKGTVAALTAILTQVPGGLGEELQRIDFSAAAVDGGGRSIFHGTNLSVTATRSSLGGDGRVNVGYIDATAVGGGTGLDLGMVTIRGDLGQIDAGDAATGTPAAKGLSVQSMGQFGTSTQGAGASLVSNFNGGLGFLKVSGNIQDACLSIGGGADGRIGSVTIGGSLIGGTAGNSGRVYSSGAMGPVKVLGNVEGGDGMSSGSIGSDGPIAGVNVGGSVFGGDGLSSGIIYGSGALGPVKIAGAIVGGGGVDSGFVGCDASLLGVDLGGSLIGGVGEGSGTISSTGVMGAVKIGGSVVGGTGEQSASIESMSTLASLTLRGSLIGGAGDNSGRVYIDDGIGVVKIAGNLQGGAGEYSGWIKTDLRIAAVIVRGSMIGGSDDEAGAIWAGNAIGSLWIGGNLGGGTGNLSARVHTESTLGAVTIGGSIRGGEVYSNGSMGAVRVMGNVEAAGGASSGSIVCQDGILASVTIGGSLIGGPTADSGRIFGDDGIGIVKIGGDVRGGAGHESGVIVSNAGVTAVSIGGSLIGGTGSQSGGIDCGDALGSVRIGRNIEGGDAEGLLVVNESGFISARRLSSLFVAGSIIAGSESAGGSLVDSGSVRVTDDIGPMIIKGSLIGNTTTSVLITARGQSTPGLTTDVAIKSLTVGGRAERADILAGYNTADIPAGVNADAQIGAVTIGNWIASNLVAGVQDDDDPARDDFFGEGDDQAIAGGSPNIISRISRILITGTVLGTIGVADSFGFVAQHIGSFKIGATSFPLSTGIANDLTALLVGPIGDVSVREVDI